jgi:hypothetical protein
VARAPCQVAGAGAARVVGGGGDSDVNERSVTKVTAGAGKIQQLRGPEPQ